MSDKKPPIEKIYEAFGALADGRVNMEHDRAVVISSNREKKYSVRWNGDTYSSTDSATHWQHYPGYPVIAVLMLQKKLPFDAGTAKLFAGVNWNELNKRHKRDYSAAAEEVMAKIAESGADIQKIKNDVSLIYERLCSLDIKIGSVRDLSK